MRTRLLLLVVLAATAAVAALAEYRGGGSCPCCGGRSPPARDGAEAGYAVTGTVVAVNPGKKTVTLDHEDIPGLMKAMRMEFGVADANLLDGLTAGDAVAGRLAVRGGDYVLTELKKR